MTSVTIHHLPLEVRPRERLLRNGENSLSLTELLAILIGKGVKGKNAIHLAEELLARFSGIEGVLEASIEELMAIKGIGKAKSIQLKAAFAIALRTKRDAFFSRPKITSPYEAYLLFKELFYENKKELLAILLRNIQKEVTHLEIIAIGSISEVISHPREIFCPAIRKSAHNLILAHNHPSGEANPSLEDIELTHRLIAAGHILGIPLEDHIILGNGSFISLWEKGVIQRIDY